MNYEELKSLIKNVSYSFYQTCLPGPNIIIWPLCKETNLSDRLKQNEKAHY